MSLYTFTYRNIFLKKAFSVQINELQARMRSLQAQVAQQSGWGPPPPGPGMPTAGLHMAGHPTMLGPPQVK
jgi:hypothetical protein